MWVDPCMKIQLISTLQSYQQYDFYASLHRTDGMYVKSEQRFTVCLSFNVNCDENQLHHCSALERNCEQNACAEPQKHCTLSGCQLLATVQPYTQRFVSTSD